MSIRKRKLPSGRTIFEVRWRDVGRNRSKSFPTHGEAKTFDDEISRLRRQGDLAWEMSRRDLTVLQLAEDWWERRASTVSKSTQASYARHLDKRILPVFGSRRAVTLRPGDIERWMQKMRDEETGEPTIAHAVAALQSVLTLAVRDGLLVANPVSGAHRPAVVRERHPVLIRPITVERMIWDLRWRGREREAVLLELLAYAGLRPESEAITLTWRQVTDRTITVTSRKGRQARPKTRSVPIFPPLARTLAEWRLRSGRPGPDQLVIPCNGGPWSGDDWRNWQRRVFKPVAWWAYLPADVIARDLRGSLASLLIHEGRPVPDVAEIMGHGAEVCLRVYAQIWAEFDFQRRVSAVDTMESARARVRTEYARWQKAEEGFTRNAA